MVDLRDMTDMEYVDKVLSLFKIMHKATGGCPLDAYFEAITKAATSSEDKEEAGDAVAKQIQDMRDRESMIARARENCLGDSCPKIRDYWSMPDGAYQYICIECPIMRLYKAHFEDVRQGLQNIAVRDALLDESVEEEV